MKILNVFLIVAALMIGNNLSAQKLKVTSGDLSNLSGVNKVSVVYDNTEIKVGKFDKEEEYVASRSAEMNEDEAGHGDKWKEEWYADKEKNFEPKFEELFNNYSQKIFIDETGEVEMLVKTTFIEPGFNVGVARRPALINLTITFKKGDEELVVITITNSPGSGAMGYDFDAGFRIQEAYAKAGKELGKLLTKKVK